MTISQASKSFRVAWARKILFIKKNNTFIKGRRKTKRLQIAKSAVQSNAWAYKNASCSSK